MKKANKETYIISTVVIIIIIIAGIIVSLTKGFNKELLYSNRQEIILSNSTGFDTSKVQEIAEPVLDGKKVKVLEVEKFGNAVEIISTEITEEEKEDIVTKINEEYEDEISSEDIDIITIPSTKIRDVIKPYILPGIITFVIVLLYFIIIYRKIGVVKVLLKGLCTPIVIELTYYAIIAITRIPFGRVVNAIAIGIFVITIEALTIYFQKEKEGALEKGKKENDE